MVTWVSASYWAISLSDLPLADIPYILTHVHRAFGHPKTSLEQPRLEYREGRNWGGRGGSSCAPVSQVGSLLVSASTQDEQVLIRWSPNVFSPHKALYQSASSSLWMPSISAMGSPGLNSYSHVVSQLGLQSSYLLAETWAWLMQWQLLKGLNLNSRHWLLAASITSLTFSPVFNIRLRKLFGEGGLITKFI